MVAETLRKNAIRARRAARTRARVRGSAVQPRLSVFRSNRGMYAQLIDDVKGVTLAHASSREMKDAKGKSTMAEGVGALLAKRALEAGIKAVIFDRGAYRYHGRVKALAEAARAGGLKF